MQAIHMLLALVLVLMQPASALVLPSAAAANAVRSRSATPIMGNNAPEGPFSPIVRVGKVVLGEKLFNKVRGKAIGYHSQFISEFCEDYGVSSKMRGGLIKKAKTTGGLLGFLS